MEIHYCQFPSLPVVNPTHSRNIQECYYLVYEFIMKFDLQVMVVEYYDMYEFFCST